MNSREALVRRGRTNALPRSRQMKPRASGLNRSHTKRYCVSVSAGTSRFGRRRQENEGYVQHVALGSGPPAPIARSGHSIPANQRESHRSTSARGEIPVCCCVCFQERWGGGYKHAFTPRGLIKCLSRGRPRRSGARI